MKKPAQPLLDAGQAALIQGGVSISVGSSSPDLAPSVGRALGCRVAADRLRVSVMLPAAQCASLLADLRTTGRVAAAFSEMATLRTIQLKGTDAVVEAADADDLQAVSTYREAFLGQLELLGFARERMQVLLAAGDDALVAVRFTPAEAYTQTPGPEAGEPLQTGG